MRTDFPDGFYLHHAHCLNKGPHCSEFSNYILNYFFLLFIEGEKAITLESKNLNKESDLIFHPLDKSASVADTSLGVPLL